MIRKLIPLFAVLLLPLSAEAALNAYLKLKGQKSGEISSKASIVSPRDAASGLPTGKRMHKPFVIEAQLDASSPLLKELREGGKLGEIVVEADKSKGAKGDKQDFLIVKLENVLVTSYKAAADGSVTVVLEAEKADGFLALQEATQMESRK